MEKGNKGALIIIIVLLIVFVPLAFLTTTYKFKENKEKAQKPVTKALPEFYENGTLNFVLYNSLLGTYTCNNTNDVGYCGWAYETIDDDIYALDYYEDTYLDELPIVNSRFAFIVDTASSYNQNNSDNANIFLYDIKGQEVLASYKAVKNYTIGLDGDYFIVKDLNDLWGVIKLDEDEIVQVAPFEYEYIGVQNQIANAKETLDAEFFVALKNRFWYVLDNTGSVLNSPISAEIYQYDSNVIVGLYNNKYSLYNYYGNMLLNSTSYDGMKIVGKYILTIDTYGKYEVVNYNTNEVVSTKSLTLESINDINYDFNDDGTINIYKGDSLIETIK